MDNHQNSAETAYDPTPDRVFAACQQFDKQNWASEEALTELFGRYPRNDSMPHVLLKVAALDALYSTRILALQDVARHIHGCSNDVDAALAIGSCEIVDTVAPVTILATGKRRWNYSFASKYCSWHKQDSYPIWDSRVNAYLTWLKHRPSGTFLVTSPDNWKHYGEFVDMIDNLRNVYSLRGFSYKQLDKFLYAEGTKLIAEKERVRTGSK